MDAETIASIIDAFETAPKSYDGKWRIEIYRRWRVNDRNDSSNRIGAQELLATVHVNRLGSELLVTDYDIRTVMPEEPFKDFKASLDDDGNLSVSGLVSTHFFDANFQVANLRRLDVDAILPRIMPYRRTIEITGNNFEEDLAFDVKLSRVND